MLPAMAIWITTTDGRTERVKTGEDDADDAMTIEAIVNRNGWPRENGWIELEGRHRHFVRLAQVVSVEIRSRETSARNVVRSE
jgi:hypothetical protein